MGQYEPHDSRNVTLKPGPEPGGIERTGPREGETRAGRAASGGAHVQDVGTAAIGAQQAGEPVVPETSTDPATRAEADARRLL
jgi:hypothetical protein